MITGIQKVTEGCRISKKTENKALNRGKHLLELCQMSHGRQSGFRDRNIKTFFISIGKTMMQTNLVFVILQIWWHWRLTPGSELRDHSWWAQGTIQGAKDWTGITHLQGKVSYLPYSCPIFSNQYLFTSANKPKYHVQWKKKRRPLPIKLCFEGLCPT